ncbi:MAG: slipin family protein, partial [Acidobacteriota bacterium]
MSPTIVFFSLPIFLFTIVVLSKWVNILREYERGVTFWLGKLTPNIKGPGLVLVKWPFETMERISLRTVVLDP